MFYYLFIDVLTFTFFIFIGSQLTREIPLQRHSKIKIKVLYGLLGSFINFAFFILKIEDSLIFINSSLLSVMLIYHYGGILSAFITGLCFILFLVMKYGFSSFILYLLFGLITTLSLFKLIDKKITNRWKRWISYLIVCVFFNFSIVLFVPNYVPVLIKNILIISITGSYIFYILKYLESTSSLFVKYKTEALYDYLTGLNNTRAFDIRFNKITHQSNLYELNLALLMIDIDFFKKINDSYGHEVGDSILKELGSILKSHCRYHDVVSRIGGEEFCILMTDCDKEKARSIGENIRHAVEEYPFYNKENEAIHITVSIGIAVYPDTTKNTSDLKNSADDAVYQAKHNGRNMVCIL